MTYLEKVEASIWRSKLRKVILPILLSFGCGTEKQKDDTPVENTEVGPSGGGSGSEPVSRPSNPGDIDYTPGPARRVPPSKPQKPDIGKRETRDFAEELRKNGFACQFYVSSPTKMRWVFGLLPEGADTQNTSIYSLSLNFTREDPTSPWDFANPTISGNGQDPQLKQLIQDVMAELDAGVDYIQNKYGCSIKDSPHKI